MVESKLQDKINECIRYLKELLLVFPSRLILDLRFNDVQSVDSIVVNVDGDLIGSRSNVTVYGNTVFISLTLMFRNYYVNIDVEKSDGGVNVTVNVYNALGKEVISVSGIASDLDWLGVCRELFI